MEHQDFAEYLTDRYEDQVGWYDRKAAANQKTYRWMQWLLIVLAAVTPILIEMRLEELLSPEFGRLPTVTAAVVAILTAGLKTFKYQENWIAYRTTCETLKKERYLYEAGIGEYRDAQDKEALFVERVEGLISRENTMWVSTHRQERASGEKAKPA